MSPFRGEFRECPECAAKSGSPDLCPSCVHNRMLIEHLYDQISRYGKQIGVLRTVLEL